jgi:SAM-dependent methyltransferase
VTSVTDGTLRIVRAARRYVPVGVKRPLKRAIPRRYHRVFDPDWHRRSIGNAPRWDELGRLQFDYLASAGLKPHHYFLDVGCGPLRGGVHYIRYLEPGHYFGVDKNAAVLKEACAVELPRYELDGRGATVVAMEDFGFRRLGQTFDYALAQSVFTHLPLNSIIRCLMNIEQVLVPGGRFYATFYENPDGKRNLDDIQQTPRVVTHFDRDYYHYDLGAFAWVCEGTSLSVEYLGDWNNPQNQKMLLFTKNG